MTDTSEPKAVRIGDAVQLGAGIGGTTGIVAALIDTANIALSGFDGQLGFLSWYALSSLLLGCLVLGSFLGAWTALCWRAALRLPKRFRGPLGTLLLALPGAVFIGWVPTSWLLEHWDELGERAFPITAGVYVGALLVSWALAAVSHRIVRLYAATGGRLPRLHFPVLAVALTVTTASFWADRRVLVGLYDDFHHGLAVAFLSFLAATLRLFWLTIVRHRRRRGWLSARAAQLIVAGTGTVALLSVVLLEWLSPDVFGPSQSVLFNKLSATVRKHTDVDGDGYSNLFGGSDCAPWNAAIRPGKLDLPIDDVDDDCSGTPARWPPAEPSPEYEIPNRKGYNLLLITVDALRADHVGAWGYEKNPTTPNIDRLASESIRFARAFTTSPKTYDAMPSLVTGLYPSNIPRDYRVKLPKGQKPKPYAYRITNEVELLPETLQKQGYVTGAAHGVSLLKILALDRGFDEHKSTRKQNEFAIDFLNRHADGSENEKPFFLWLHHYSPHATYLKRDGFDFGNKTIDRYDSEIAYDDDQVGRLLDELSNRGLSDRTIVVLTADHGEEFREHGGTLHGFKLYRELIHVPLLLKIPGVEPQVVEAPVELTDVMPTLCQVLDISQLCSDHDGHSLLAAAAGKRPKTRGAFSEMYRRNDVLLMNGLYTDQWHMIYDYKKDRAELYDIRVDKNEQRNVARANPKVVQQFRDRLALRTLYRQGLTFSEYRRSGDSVVLAKRLDVFRRRRMLRLVLKEMEKDLRAAHKPHLKRLLKRPQLNKKIKRRCKKLLARLKRKKR